MVEAPTSAHSRVKTLAIDIGRLRGDAMASTSIIVKSVRLSTGIVHAQLLINGNGGNGSGYDGVGGNATHVNNIDQSVPAPAPNFTSTLRRGIA